MKVSFIGQGLKAGATVGSTLIKSFAEQDFNSFSCLVAFASQSGIGAMSASIDEAKKYMKQIEIYVGIDQYGTSKEALEALLSLGVKTSIFYTFQHIIFHPKIYLFEGDGKCRIIIGSSNLTTPGLFQNIEASLLIDFEKPDREGEIVLSQIRGYFESFFGENNRNLQDLTKELIQELVEEGIVPDEAKRATVQEKELSIEEAAPRELTKKLKTLFPSFEIQKPPAGTRKIRTVKAMRAIPEYPTEEPEGIGQLLWKKVKLPPSDVQYHKEGTNPTGGLRLTQANWKVSGLEIDQTTYFRNEIFGDLEWVEEHSNPKVEVTSVLFKVKILGKDFGEHRLEIRHKPSGVAGQGNYTTSLSWGELGKLVEKEKLVGKTFCLYGPIPGQREPFVIEIV